MTLTENIIMNERDNAIQFGQHIPANKIAIQAMVHQDPFSSQSQEGLSSPQSDHTQSSPLSETPNRDFLFAVSPTLLRKQTDGGNRRTRFEH